MQGLRTRGTQARDERAHQTNAATSSRAASAPSARRRRHERHGTKNTERYRLARVKAFDSSRRTRASIGKLHEKTLDERVTKSEAAFLKRAKHVRRNADIYRAGWPDFMLVDKSGVIWSK